MKKGGELWFTSGSPVSSGAYALTLRIEDVPGAVSASGASSASVEVDDEQVASQQASCSGPECTVQLSTSVDPAQLTEGEHQVTLHAVDAAGNEVEESFEIEVRRPPSAPPQVADAASVTAWTVTGEAIGDRAGGAVATISDINGDGVDEIAVGAPGRDVGLRVDAGRVYVLDGATSQSSSLGQGTVLGRIDGPSALSRAGTALAAPGDVTGDGLDDLLVGVPGPLASAGQVFVVSGTALRQDIDLSALGARGRQVTGPSPDLALLSPNRKFGAVLSSAAVGDSDFNGDGTSDFIIAAPNDHASAAQPPAAYVIFGSQSTAPIAATNLANGGAKITPPPNASGFAGAAALVQDMDGDGAAEAVIGAPGAVTDTQAAGSAFVVYGRQSSAAAIDLSSWSASSGTRGFRVNGLSGGHLASTVAPAGDIDGDGAGDVVLGGRIPVLLYGKDTTETVDIANADALDATRFSVPAGTGDATVTAARDVDADGVDDVAVAIPGSQAPGTTGTPLGTIVVLTIHDGDFLSSTQDLAALPGELGRSFTGPVNSSSGFALQPATDHSSGKVLLGDASVGAAAGRLDALRVGNVTQSQRTAARAADPSCAAAGRPYTFAVGSSDFPKCRYADGPGLNKDESKGVGRRKGWKGAHRRLHLTSATSHSGGGGTGRFDFKKKLMPGQHTLVDSFGTPIVRIQEPIRGQFTLTLPDGTEMGSTANTDGTRPAALQLDGRGCMDTVARADDYALVYLKAGTDKDKGYALEIRGFLPRSAIPPLAFEDTDSPNDTVIDSFWLPCAGRGDFRKQTNKGSMYDLSGFPTDELYQSGSGARACNRSTDPAGEFSPKCGTPLANYSFPQYPPKIEGGTNFPRLAVMTSATTGVVNGGIQRGIIATGDGIPVRVLETIGYADPNIPCGQKRVVSWDFVKVGPIAGWLPRRTPALPRRESRQCPPPPRVELTEARDGVQAGTVNPNGLATEYRFVFEMSLFGGDFQPPMFPTPYEDLEAGTAAVPVSASVGACFWGFPATMRVRLEAKNSVGEAMTEPLTYTLAPDSPCSVS